MIPQPGLDEETFENDVRYGIAGCRERLRSRRATLRAQHQSPTDVSNGVNVTSAGRSSESYAEILATLSMSQSSMARLVECLLEPAVPEEPAGEAEQEEAVVT